MNRYIADLMDIPHVGCGSHKLNLEVKAIISTDRVLQYTIDSVHSTMTSCKSGLKKSALLRNANDLNPVLNDETRWSSIHHMLSRYNRIRESLISAADSTDSSLTLERSFSFKSKAHIYAKHFPELIQLPLSYRKGD